jgi:uncharacterized protein YaaQ
MKLVVTIVQNDDADDLLEALTAADFRATRLASTGGFLRQGNTTIIVGVPDEEVEQVVQTIAHHTQQPNLQVSPNPTANKTNGRSDKAVANPLDLLAAGANLNIATGRATVFVLNLERFERV